jgi:hypothetical protein
MKHRILIAFLLIIFLTGCDESYHFNKDQLKKALFTCLNNDDLKGLMFSDSLTNKTSHFHLYGNGSLSDSLKIDHRVYYVNKGSGNIHKDSILVYKLTYKNEKTASIYLLYQPGHGFRIVSQCDFVFYHDEWKLEHRTNGIMDGRF